MLVTLTLTMAVYLRRTITCSGTLKDRNGNGKSASEEISSSVFQKVSFIRTYISLILI